MNIHDVFGLRNQGRKEEAYEAARTIYATDKSPYASSAMFWTAVDVLKMCVHEGRMAEADRIFKALVRLLDTLKDEKGWMHNAMKECQDLIVGKRTLNDLQEKKADHILLGEWGEEVAADYLREKGYVILERDWHSKHRDIDLIAQQGDIIVFIEVKTRHNREVADPLQAVNYQKRTNLIQAISHYINYHNSDAPWRFDVITIVGALGCSNPEINHIEDFALR